LQVPPRVLALAVSALVVVALLVIGLSTGGGSNQTSGGKQGQGQGRQGVSGVKKADQVNPKASRGHSLQLAAKGEVWVCLLDGKGKALIDGQILNSGETEGPFWSGSFTLALGNGAVTMTVDGKQANTPEPSSPIGFVIDSHGSVRELPEGERPTCT
jgi:hypothetical protein